MVSGEGDLEWDRCAFVPSKGGLTKEVVFHAIEGGPTVITFFFIF